MRFPALLALCLSTAVAIAPGPYAVASGDAFMQMVLTHEWPHEPILAAVAPFEGAPKA